MNNDPLGLQSDTFAEHYRIAEYVAAGGIAAVYKGVDTRDGTIIAVKVLDARSVGADRADELKERFHREAESCTALTSPHTIRMLAHGTTLEGCHYMVLEWLEGENLHQRMRSTGRLEPLRLIGIMKQLCLALAEAHSAGVVHRDLKPGNVLLTPTEDGSDHVTLLDFGLAKHVDAEITLTRAGSVMGTPTYMSPEQIEGAAGVDHRTDIYALGVMCFRGLTNKRPFGGKNPAQVMSGHLQKPVPALSAVAPDLMVPRNLEWTVRTCMNKDRDDRFTDVDELRLALRTCELELQGELAEPVDLQLVAGRMDIPKELRARLTELEPPTSPPAPVIATLKAAPASEAPPRPLSFSDLWLPMALAGAGVFAIIAVMVWALQ